MRPLLFPLLCAGVACDASFPLGNIPVGDVVVESPEAPVCAAPPPGIDPCAIVSPTATCGGFTTITEALGTSGCGLIWIAPGSYDESTGEFFPLAVPAGVTLLGDEETLGASTIVSQLAPVADAAAVTVQLADDAVVGGLTLMSAAVTTQASVVLLAAAGPTLRNSTVRGVGSECDGSPTPCALGVRLTQASADVSLLGNRIEQTAGGVALEGTSLLEGNVIVDNGFGMRLGGDGFADLGGGRSAGGNVFSCNAYFDVLITGFTGTLSMSDNAWDHAPPSSAASPSCVEGATDICAPAGFAVVVARPTLLEDGCD